MKVNPDPKVAIVTGAGQGIGLEICKKLIGSGAQVILNDLDEELTGIAARDLGEACIPVTGDASDPQVIRQMIDTAISRFGRLDIAIANAGITLFGEFLSFSPESFSRLTQVNLAGSFFLAQAAAHQMKNQAQGGSLLLMSSAAGQQAHRNLVAYGMTKAALAQLARSLVSELSEFHINVNALAPGATSTERTLEDAEYERTWSRITPLGRTGTVEDVAHAALFLVSDKARHITGQTITIDGGWTCMGPSPY
jgi:NAD(P)-dependent dehydrogenase (short-subunit alcohol dehydrogenase family)